MALAISKTKLTGTLVSNRKQANCVSPCLLHVLSRCTSMSSTDSVSTICVTSTPLTLSISSYCFRESRLLGRMIRRLCLVVMLDQQQGQADNEALVTQPTAKCFLWLELSVSESMTELRRNSRSTPFLLCV